MKEKRQSQLTEFNYILGMARKKEITDWVRNCHAQGIISKQELEDRLCFLEENWEERLTQGKHSTMAKNLEEVLGFFETPDTPDEH